MLTLLSDYLMLSDEPAALIRGGRVIRLNGSAEALLGAQSVGRSVRQVFGDEIANVQAPRFLASVSLQGRPHTVRLSRVEGFQVAFISREERDLSVVSDAAFAAMRGSLMTLGLSAEQGRRRAEALGDEELERSLAAVTKQYFLLNRLVGNASTVHMLLRGALPLNFTAVDLASLCRSTAETLSLLRAEPRFVVSAPEELLLNADAPLLETLLLNLLSNCLLHAEGLSTVSIGLTETEKSVILSVSDDGCGIPPEQLPMVFSRYRAAFDAAATTRGSGLGLSVVRGIADRHGGTLLLESREGQGTSVRVSLSKQLCGAKLRGAAEPWHCEMSSLLTGLAPCLPDDCFSAKYLD